jgi:hypothetical protein
MFSDNLLPTLAATMGFSCLRLFSVLGKFHSEARLGTFFDGLGTTPLQVNYLSISVYIFACWTSDKLKKRGLIVMMVPIHVFIGYAIVVGSANNGAGLFAMFLIAAGKSILYPSALTLLTHGRCDTIIMALISQHLGVQEYVDHLAKHYQNSDFLNFDY